MTIPIFLNLISSICICFYVTEKNSIKRAQKYIKNYIRDAPIYIVECNCTRHILPLELLTKIFCWKNVGFIWLCCLHVFIKVFENKAPDLLGLKIYILQLYTTNKITTKFRHFMTRLITLLSIECKYYVNLLQYGILFTNKFKEPFKRRTFNEVLIRFAIRISRRNKKSSVKGLTLRLLTWVTIKMWPIPEIAPQKWTKFIGYRGREKAKRKVFEKVNEDSLDGLEEEAYLIILIILL